VTRSGRTRVSVGVALAALFLAASAAPVAGQGAAPPRVLVKELTVEGNRRVQDAVILGAVKSKIGTPFNPALLSDDVRAIFALGFFDDVQMRVEDFEGGVKVTFVVTERSFVRDVAFVGNKHLKTDTLQEKIDLKLGRVYNPVDVQRARQTLLEYYEEEGYYEAQITPETEKFPDGDVRVVFSINEGRRIKIDRIVFHGNKGLTARQLKGIMATHEREYYIPFWHGTIQRQKLDEDVERIVALYNDHGYIQARVESHDVKVDRERALVNIEFTVVEGLQYRVGDVKLTGVTLLPEAEVSRQVKLHPGDVFSRSALRDSVRAVTDLYSTIGRASADVLPKTEPNAQIQRIDVTLEVTEGPEVYVERINITGNVRSQEKILRREIPMVEGDRFTLQKLQRARQRLVNLGYFDKVDVTTTPGADKTKIVVNVDVTERPTGIFSIGGGYSSVDGVVGTIDLSQRNFLGRGWETAIRLRGGARTQQGVISFTEPWLFDRPISAGFDLFDNIRQFNEYTLDSLGGGLRTSRPFAEYARWHLGYRLTRDKVSRLTTEDPALLAEKGIRVTSVVEGALSRDSRDNVMAPTKGASSNLTIDFAGIGGDSRFIKAVASTSYFHPVWFHHVLSGRVETGYGFGWAKDPLPLFERFYLGGPNSIRGFKFRKISPIDDAGVRIGGTTEVLGNAEYLITLPNFGIGAIRLAAFFDVGNVYGFKTKFDLTDLRYSAGPGVRWNSPFGPIRVDYGVNLDPRRGEAFGAFQFSVGAPF
jgi:outer membrane protein insertion porin family